MVQAAAEQESAQQEPMEQTAVQTAPRSVVEQLRQTRQEHRESRCAEVLRLREQGDSMQSIAWQLRRHRRLVRQYLLGSGAYRPARRIGVAPRNWMRMRIMWHNAGRPVSETAPNCGGSWGAGLYGQCLAFSSMACPALPAHGPTRKAAAHKGVVPSFSETGHLVVTGQLTDSGGEHKNMGRAISATSARRGNRRATSPRV